MPQLLLFGISDQHLPRSNLVYYLPENHHPHLVSVPQNRNYVNILLNQLLQFNTVRVKKRQKIGLKNSYNLKNIDNIFKMISLSGITKTPSLEPECFGSESIKKTYVTRVTEIFLWDFLLSYNQYYN